MTDQFGEQSGSFAERRSPHGREEVIQRILQEFDEMAGLSLTIPQACRLFFVSDRERCDRIIQEVVNRGLLKVTEQGLLVRPDK